MVQPLPASLTLSQATQGLMPCAPGGPGQCSPASFCSSDRPRFLWPQGLCKCLCLELSSFLLLLVSSSDLSLNKAFSESLIRTPQIWSEFYLSQLPLLSLHSRGFITTWNNIFVWLFDKMIIFISKLYILWRKGPWMLGAHNRLCTVPGMWYPEWMRVPRVFEDTIYASLP